MTLSVKVVNQDVVTFRMDRALLRVNTNLERTVEREAINLTAYVKQNKLSDQVLHVRTGRLRRSITYRLERDGEGAFRALVGTNVAYARVHEQGFTGTVNVRQHVRRLRKRGEVSLKKVKGRDIGVWTKKRGEPTGDTVEVRAHTMKMNIRARPFLMPSLEDNTPRITDNLRKALAEALQP